MTIQEIERINLKRERSLPKDYVGESRFAKRYVGRLVRPDGSVYNRLERRSYYRTDLEKNHPAKTPVHIARWAIQNFTNPGDWILDPTCGAGTSMVEAILLGRNSVGVDIEFTSIARANVQKNKSSAVSTFIYDGDARRIDTLIKRPVAVKFNLIINNPPYSGDLHEGRPGPRPYKMSGKYDRRYMNLAFLNEGEEYWSTMEMIYRKCSDLLVPGGYFVIGVKDMMRRKKVLKLHEKFGEILEKFLTYRMMTVLLHYPPTLFISTYEKHFGVPVPRYQTILVFQKEKTDPPSSVPPGGTSETASNTSRRSGGKRKRLSGDLS